MNKKFLTHVAALSLAAVVMVPSAMALSWRDGAPANYKFTYANGDEGIASVTASDTNDTFEGEVKEGQTITTKTGTIVWRDSYTNTTTFTVEVKPGYELVGLTGENVTENDFEEIAENTYSFQFTDKGAEAWCYGKDVKFNLTTENMNRTLTVNAYTDNRSGECKTYEINAIMGDEITYPWLVEHEPELADYQMIGGESVIVTEDTTINLVKYTPAKEGFSSYEYGFLFGSKTADIESVEYSIDGSDWTVIDVNEGVKFETGPFASHTITFCVKVAEGKQLVLEDNNSKCEVEQQGEYYTFQYTRTISQGTSGLGNTTFHLSAVEK